MRQITLNLAAGTRPYLFLVCSSVNSGGTNRPIVMLTNAGGTSTGASLEIRKNSAQTFMFRTHGNVPGKVVALYIIGVASPVMTLLFQTSVQLVTSDPDRTMPDALDHHATRKPEPAE
jgi:hypothetical protein